jgi:hypothetical protein
MRSKFNIGLVVLFFALIGACEEYLGPSVDCSECFYEKPDSADLVIELTINGNHPEVPITVYRGNADQKVVDWVDTARETPYYLYSRIDQLYSVEAEYRVGGRIIIAVDGDAMKAKHVSDQCDSECWIVTGGYLKVELKFD